MSAILEAYWTLASKRFIDNACMCLDDRILGTLCGKLQEQCYQFVHDENKLQAFFTEDAALVASRSSLEEKRDRLIKANTAMANIQVNRKLIRSHGTSSGQTDVVSISIGTGAHGLGLQLADEDHLVVIRGFRTGSAAKQAGVKLNDVLIKINGESFASFQEAIGKLKTSNQGQINLTLRREIIQVRSNS